MVNLNKRSSGVLLPLFSLCGNEGIGTMGKAAFDFVDFLKKSGQKYWQILPLGTTGYSNSPYQSFSSFAGNENFIDFDLLYQAGFLKKSDYFDIGFFETETKIDYSLLISKRKKVLFKAFENFKKAVPNDFYEFEEDEKYWLDDFSLFMAIKEKNNSESFFYWKDEKLKKCDSISLSKFRTENSNSILYYKMLQYFFFTQWYSLKSYANKKGVYIIGDMPFYVSSDSCDVWKNPDLFAIDENYNIKFVSGCPPDNFSENGQLWGNVIYDMGKLKEDGYSFWLKRLSFAFKMYDVLRIDHFRAFEAYYSIPYPALHAKDGKWIKGVGCEFFETVKNKLGNLPIIAEDLGFQTNEVKELLKKCGFLGMKVLQFAFDSNADNDYLPHNLTANSVIYTGTHDNNTLKGWIDNASEKELSFAKEYLRAESRKELFENMILASVSSVSNICIIPFYDLLGLNSEARINIPGTLQDNWQWRMTKEQFESVNCEKLLYYTKLYGRTEG